MLPSLDESTPVPSLLSLNKYADNYFSNGYFCSFAILRNAKK